jgi:hypothetical protein
VLDTPSTESPHGKTLPTGSVMFSTSWYGSVGRIGAVDLRLALHRLLLVEPPKRTIIKVRMQWLSIDCLDWTYLRLLSGWLIVRLSPWMYPRYRSYSGQIRANHPIGGFIQSLLSPIWGDQRVHGHWLAKRQKISAWPLATIDCWTFAPLMNSSATVLPYLSVVMRRMLTFWLMSIPLR